MTDLSAGYPLPDSLPTNPLNNQVGGAHYKQYAIQPVEWLELHPTSYCLENVIKYVMRYREKDGAKDIRKCLHYLELYEHLQSEGKASGRMLVDQGDVLAMCRLNALDEHPRNVLLALQTDAYGEFWLKGARYWLEQILVNEYGALADGNGADGKGAGA